MILGKILFLILSVVLFIYIFWQRLKDDYIPDHIFTTEVYVLSGLLLSLIAKRFIPAYWFFVAFVTVILFCGIGVKRFKMRWNEAYDSLIVSLMPGAAMYFAVIAIENRAIESAVMAVTSVLLFFAYFVLSKHYKSLSFYPSGKIGFAGFTVLGFFFLVASVVAIAVRGVVPFNSSYDAYLSGIAALVSFSIVAALSRKS